MVPHSHDSSDAPQPPTGPLPSATTTPTVPHDAEALTDAAPRPAADRFFQWRLPADGWVTRDLPRWRAFTGQQEQAVRGLGWLDAVHPEDRPRVRDDWDRSVAEGTPLASDCRVRRSDGVFCFLSLHLLPLFDGHGRLRQWEGSCVDVTERQLAEREHEEAVTRALAARRAAAQTRVLAREQAARAAAEAANEELRRLQALTDTALAHLGLEDLLPELLGRICRVMDVEDVALLLLDGDGQHLTLRAARGLADAVAAQATVPVGQGIAGRIAATRAPLVVDDLATFDVFYPQLRETQRSAVGVPLLVEDRLLGIVYVGSATSRHFADHDVQLLQRAADRVALAIDRVRLFEAEQAARQEAAQERVRWQAAMDSTPEFVITCDAQLRVTYVNPAYEPLRGGPANQSVPMELRAARYGLFLPNGIDLFPADQLPLTRAVREDRPVRGVEMVLRNSDGDERVVVWEAAPMRTPQGERLGAVAIGRDITERKRLEQEHAEQAEQLDRIFEQMADGVAIYDAQGRLVRTNPAVRRILGLDAAPPGYSERPLPDRWALYAVRDDQGRPVKHGDGPLARALRGETLTAVDMQVAWMRALDGRDIAVNTSAAPLWDREGRLVGAVSIYHELTERKRAEEALQASEARYRDLVETQTELICRYLPDGTLTFVNGAYCRRLGRSHEELIGARFPDLLLPAQAQRARALLAQMVEHPGVVTDEHEVVRPDGSHRWEQWTDHPIFDASGHLIEIQAIGRDITERKQAEQALRESEERYRAVVETQTEMITRYLPDTTVTFVNEANCRMMGKSREQILGTRWLDMLPDAAREPVRATIQSLLEHPGVRTVEHQVRLPDGSLTWQQWVHRTILDEAGQVVELQGIGRDITERKRAEEALRSSEERFRTMADTAPVLIWLAGPEGLVTFVNAPWLQFTGRSLEQELGNGWAEGVHPEDYDRCLQTYRTAFHARERFTMEYRLHRHDGEYRWVVDSGVPRFAQDGTFLGYIGSAIDITERKRLEREREEARAEAERQAAQLDRVFEQMADGVTLYDAQGRILRENAAQRRILGLDAAPPGYYQLSLDEQTALYRVRDEQGHPLAPEQAPMVRALAGEVLTGAGAQDLRVRTLDGREVELNVSAAPLHDREGHLVGAVRVLRDQTERKRLEREREEARAGELALREVNRHMEQFLAAAAHDLRSPVAGALMGVELARRRVQRLAATVPPVVLSPPILAGKDSVGQPDEAQAALAALAHADYAVQRLSRLIVRLFDIAEARTGTLEVRRARCDLAPLVREEVAAQRLAAPGRTIDLDLGAGVDAPVVILGDGDRLSQVLANYVSNALKYSPPDQPIMVSLEVRLNQARVAVHDAGPGLPPEEQERVWELFHRAPGVTEQGNWGGSMGLGLYLCKQIVERHDGQVGVESEVGAGSTFWFTLPLAEPEETAQDAITREA